MRKSQRKNFETIKKEAIAQLEGYLNYDDNLLKLEYLKAYVIVFVVQEGYAFEVLKK